LRTFNKEQSKRSEKKSCNITEKTGRFEKNTYDFAAKKPCEKKCENKTCETLQISRVTGIAFLQIHNKPELIF
jgi:hypothetical protein